jgi:hypothetical protein
MLLTWDDKGVENLIQPRSRSTSEVNVAGWSKNLEVTADGEGIVSHAGVAQPGLSTALPAATQDHPQPEAGLPGVACPDILRVLPFTGLLETPG